ncbi:MAG: FKBP-type peptidyl-prolyl cis-trans isomerase [Bacteroidia bacterium]|nr:FKBP-type peptidyl-prolyl cis-trans isomerase [Bacteroidia bacterium]
MKKIFIGFLFIWIFLFSCIHEDFKTDKSGLRYKFFIENKDAAKPVNDDILVLKMIYKTGKDSILFSTAELSGSFRMRMKPASHEGGCIEDAFGMMHVGDSARFVIDAVNFYEKTKKTEAPLFIRQGDKIIFDIKLVKILKTSDLENEVRSLNHASEAEEYKLLEQYLKNANIKQKPEGSGLYYIETKAGTGRKAEHGMTVKIHYTGSFVDGKVFDSSLERNQPFEFKLGTRQAIPGLEEGVLKMKKGGTATLIIPSKLAYGFEQKGPVPPFSTLIFEIELLDAR